MELDNNVCYQALLTHDVRFDGVFYVGVATTKIYCRTVCPAKTPRQDRCTFYPSAAAAEQAGYRPCLRCRPELAPGSAGIDSLQRLAVAAASRMEEGDNLENNIGDLAGELGVSDRHLRRAIRQEFGVTPIALAQTQRLLLAKRLLTETDLTVTEAAFAAGFASLRRFNALFKERYRLNPTDLRKSPPTERSQETLTCLLAYRPPLDWVHLLHFLNAHAALGSEIVEDGRYMRTVRSGPHRGWLTVAHISARNALRVELSASLAPALSPILNRVKRLFDLAAEPQQIAAHLGGLAEAHPGLRVPGAYEGFDMAVRAILGQQVSVKAATTLAGRFTAALGEPITTPYAHLTHLSPTAECVAQVDVADLVGLGVLASRAKSILALAGAVAEERISLEPGADVEVTMARLRELPGIGEWTAQYIAMRALNWPDAFPHTDLGLGKALGETRPRRILERAEAWRPWRAYAAMHLWKSLEADR